MPFGDGTGPRGRGRGRGRGMGYRRMVGVARGAPTQTAMIEIDIGKCIGCGQCVSACPFGALSLVDGKAVLDQTRCRSCRDCISACPTGAIT